MTDWQTAYGSQEIKPEEFDLTSSYTVYQRKNIERKSHEGMTGETVEYWEYEERKMTYEEYYEILRDRMYAQIEQNKADIDFLAAMSDVELN